MNPLSSVRQKAKKRGEFDAKKSGSTMNEAQFRAWFAQALEACYGASDRAADRLLEKLLLNLKQTKKN